VPAPHFLFFRKTNLPEFIFTPACSIFFSSQYVCKEWYHLVWNCRKTWRLNPTDAEPGDAPAFLPLAKMPNLHSLELEIHRSMVAAGPNGSQIQYLDYLHAALLSMDKLTDLTLSFHDEPVLYASAALSSLLHPSRPNPFARLESLRVRNLDDARRNSSPQNAKEAAWEMVSMLCDSAPLLKRLDLPFQAFTTWPGVYDQSTVDRYIAKFCKLDQLEELTAPFIGFMHDWRALRSLPKLRFLRLRLKHEEVSPGVHIRKLISQGYVFTELESVDIPGSWICHSMLSADGPECLSAIQELMDQYQSIGVEIDTLQASKILATCRVIPSRPTVWAIFFQPMILKCAVTDCEAVQNPLWWLKMLLALVKSSDEDRFATLNRLLDALFPRDCTMESLSDHLQNLVKTLLLATKPTERLWDAKMPQIQSELKGLLQLRFPQLEEQ
jgi:hypothetical protein